MQGLLQRGLLRTSSEPGRHILPSREDEVRISPAQFLAIRPLLVCPLDVSLLEEPLPITGCSGKKSFQRYVSFIEHQVEVPGEICHWEIE